MKTEWLKIYGCSEWAGMSVCLHVSKHVQVCDCALKWACACACGCDHVSRCVWMVMCACNGCVGEYESISMSMCGQCACECVSQHIDNSPSWVDMILQFTRPGCSHNFTGPSELPWEQGRVGYCGLFIWLWDIAYISPLYKEWRKEKSRKIWKIRSKGEKNVSSILMQPESWHFA